MMPLLILAAASYVFTSLLLRRLRVDAPDMFLELGQPRFWELFSRNPSHFGKQFRFLGFVLSGRAFRQVPPSLRTLTAGVWVSDVGIIGWLTFFLYLMVFGKLPE